MTPGASPGLIPSPLTRGLGCLGSGQFCSWHYFSLGDFTFVGIYDLVDPRSFSQSLDSWILLSATCFYLGSHLGLGFLCQSFTCKGRDGKISWEEVARVQGKHAGRGKSPARTVELPWGLWGVSHTASMPQLEAGFLGLHIPAPTVRLGVTPRDAHSQGQQHPEGSLFRTRCRAGPTIGHKFHLSGEDKDP